MKFNVFAGLMSASLVLSGCATVVPNPTGQSPSRPAQNAGKPADIDYKPVPSVAVAALPAPQTSADAKTAAGLGLVRGPDIRSLGITPRKARPALAAFRTSCRSLRFRTDRSGITRGADWTPICAAAASWSDDDAVGFFAENLETAQVGDGKAFATGYFEPQILGSRTKKPGYNVPVYKRPKHLVDVDLGLFSDKLKGKKVRGKVLNGKLVPFDDRNAIVDKGALAGRGLEIAWAADEIDFFFLQIQGSGRLLLPDGGVMRIGYESQNGRDYTGIGRLMRKRGLLAPGKATMQGIVEYLRDNPEEGRNIMNENKSFIFFRELTGAGPLGALGVPVIPKTSVAADPKFTPLGVPVWLSMDRAEANGLWIAQDTGGAIKGSNRFDTFWGAGAEAKAIAGGMSGRGSALLLLPKGTVDRLNAAAEES